MAITRSLPGSAAVSRLRKGSVNWQVGQEILKNTTTTGPAGRLSLRGQFSPAIVLSWKSGALAPGNTMLDLSLWLTLHLLHKAQNIELADFAPGEKAVNRVHFIVEGFKDGVNFGHHQKFHASPVQV